MRHKIGKHNSSLVPEPVQELNHSCRNNKLTQETIFMVKLSFQRMHNYVQD